MLETFVDFLFLYLLLWWIVLFCALPLWVERDDNPEAGHDPGAPRHARLKRKFILTSIVALFVTLAVMLALEAGWLEQFRG